MGSFRGITFVQTTASMEIITSTASPGRDSINPTSYPIKFASPVPQTPITRRNSHSMYLSYPLTPFQPSFCVQSDQALVPVSDTVCRKGESQ